MLARSLLTLADVALLARVQRSVVTTWRARHAGTGHPFPDASVAVDGQDLFGVDEVLEWFEVTGCGNNPEAKQDAAAFALPAAEVAGDSALFAGLGALICLRGTIGPLPVGVNELVDAAERFDSDDALLFREVEALEPSQLEALARYAELLVANAFDPAEPFDELVRRRQKLSRRPPLHPALRRLVTRAAAVLTDEAGFAEPTLVVRSVEDLDLVLDAVRHTEQRASASVALTLPEGREGGIGARLARRWLYVHGLALETIPVTDNGAYVLPDGAVLVLRLPTSETDRDADLEEVSNLCLNLSPANRALVIGPAATLTDALLERRGPGRPTAGTTRLSGAGQRRRDALRTDQVRAVVRLPAGLFSEQSRSRAALWCVGPSRSTPASTMCADLVGTVTDGSTDDLLTDLTAAMRGPMSEVARQLTTARFRPTSDLSVSTDDLVAPVVRDVHLGAASVMAELNKVLDRTRNPVPGIDQPKPSPLPHPVALRRTSLEHAMQQGKITMIPGARIEAASASTRGDVPVVRHPSDLDRRDTLSGLSPLTLAITYAHVAATEPGDVVVSTVGGPAASVDHLGGAVVAFPARVLRCHRPRPTNEEERGELAARGSHPAELAPQAFTPEAVAAGINALPRSATAWKAWPLTVLPEAEVAPVEDLLSQLAARRAALLASLADVGTAISAVTQAVGSQICTLSTPAATSTPERLIL